MKRLTGRDAYGDIVANEEMQIIASRGVTNDDLHNIINHLSEKLCEYEDLEEQSRLIKIPLEAYCIVDFEVQKGFVLEETYHMSRKPLLVVRYDDNTLKSHSGYLGISVFLTKLEAEIRLKELRNMKNSKNINLDNDERM